VGVFSFYAVHSSTFEQIIPYFCQKAKPMKPRVSIIMGSTSDLKVMEKAALFFDEMEIPFEINALSAHRTPEAVEEFAKNAEERGLQVIIAGAGMAAHLPGVIAASTSLPVIGVPINATLEGMDALLAIVQMPPGIPVATVGINNALNAAILAAQMLAGKDQTIREKLKTYKSGLKQKIEKANTELKALKYRFKTN
jgi:5-(carboxyamino)imidazole ribonucleotide mutase